MLKYGMLPDVLYVVRNDDETHTKAVASVPRRVRLEATIILCGNRAEVPRVMKNKLGLAYPTKGTS